jgi:hypothetical protein
MSAWVTALAQLVTAIVLALNFWQSWKNGRAIKAVQLQTDGLSDHLVRVTGDAKYAEGVKHGEEYVKRNGAVDIKVPPA